MLRLQSLPTKPITRIPKPRTLPNKPAHASLAKLAFKNQQRPNSTKQARRCLPAKTTNARTLPHKPAYVLLATPANKPAHASLAKLAFKNQQRPNSTKQARRCLPAKTTNARTLPHKPAYVLLATPANKPAHASLAKLAYKNQQRPIPNRAYKSLCARQPSA